VFELTASMQQAARRTQLRRLAQQYRENLDRLIVALVDDDLGALAHALTDGASVPRERQATVIGRALLAGAAELGLLLGALDGAEAQAHTDAQRADLTARRTAARLPSPELAPTEHLPPDPGRPLLLARHGAEGERE
jgi:hypothetical protein